jgi:hypothetical protein
MATKKRKFKNNREYQRWRRNQGKSLLRSLDTLLLLYSKDQGVAIHNTLRDALTDLRHIADIHNLNFGAADSEAYEVYLEESVYFREEQ